MVRPAPATLALSPVLMLTVGAVVALGWWRVRAAARRGDRLGRWRAAALVAAVALLAGVLLTPVETVAASYLLTAHLLQVIVVMGFVPPLLLLGLPAADRAWPHPLAAAGRLAVHPAVAIITVNVVFFGWHAPPLYEACIHHSELYALQVASLLAVSITFWWPIVEPRGPGRWTMPPLVRLGFILLATIPQTFAGLTFALSRHVLYADYGGGLFGLTALSDQQIAGAVMAVLSKLALFAAFSVLLWRMLNEEGADDGASDDGWGRDRDDEPAPVRPPMPAWVRLLPRGRLAEEPAMPRREREAEPVGGRTG